MMTGIRMAALAVVTATALLTACGKAPEPPLKRAEASVAAAAAPAPTADAASTAGARIDSAAIDGLSLGVPLYPGATVDGGAASRIVLPAGTTWMVTLRSADPAPQVAAYYRDALQARAAGIEYADMGAAAGVGGAMLVLADPGAGLAVQVQVSPAGTGSVVQIVDTRRAR
jgi:hypothetical protein